LGAGGWGLLCGENVGADTGDGEKHFKGCRSPDDADFDWLKPVREGSRGWIGLFDGSLKI